MGRLIGALGALLIYLAAATLLAQVIVVGYCAWRWDLSRDRLVQILALAQGVDLFAMKEEALVKAEKVAVEQVSYEEILETRALKFRDLERREQALQDGIEQLRFDQRNLAKEQKRYEQLRESFETQLADLREGSLAAGMDEVRRILESIKPKQAKVQILQMLADDQLDTVVILLSDMPDQKRSKIIGEFKTAQEQEDIKEVLDRILQGVPEAELARATEDQFGQQKPPGGAQR